MYLLRFLTFFLFFLPFSSSFAGSLNQILKNPEVKQALTPPSPRYLSIVALFQQEGPYFKEWIEYHRMVGVEHFYLYNNLSTDNYLEALEPYIEMGLVELIDWPTVAGNVQDYITMQRAVYTDGVERARTAGDRWLAIIDIDEFLVPVLYDTLPQLLASFDGHPIIAGVCFPWLMFGTSGVDKIPDDKLLIETLTLNEGPIFGGNLGKIRNSGFAYKSIVRPDLVQEVYPHFCLYTYGHDHTFLPFSHGHTNHYWSRDKHFLETVKIPRREVWGVSEGQTRAIEAVYNKQTPEGEHILRFVPELRRLMELK